MRIDRLVTPWAERAPDRIAIDGTEEALTYAQLDAMANRFANALRASGVRPGDRVGVHVPRSPHTVAAMLGASRAGAVYVPLDPGSPPPRMKLVATDCGLRHVVIAPALLANWLAAGVREPVEHFFLAGDGAPPAAAAPAVVHSFGEVLAASPAPVEAAGQSSDDLAYMLYTSGSTGVPKGVMISHRNALAFTEWAADTIRLSESDRVASVAPFHFDLSVFDLWASLSRGATVVIVDETTVVSGRRMLDRIHAKAITVWYSVPSALVLMLDDGGLAERGAPSLRSVFFAGEVFPMKHLRRAMAAVPQARFYNLFGPTETNVCTAYTLPAAPPPDATAIPIGHASCGDSVAILDPEGKPVPDGEIGELFVDGPTVMLGYWDGGRRTPARRPYPTGDLVSRRPDGELMYHGRRDHLVKIHGYRVELGEVEAALLGHPGIQEGIAMAVDQQLIAVAVPADPQVSVLDVKRYCATKLPRYMVPSEVRLVEALPRTSSGKIDRVRTRTAFIAADWSLLRPAQRPELRKETT
ncbi:MAG TPA: amino acid adenylation domain-containing protein [Anaeromyxobacteraceae bacterium]|nr:amino acid adenylation domain-containing protein [Anaeromyxobacteraceae bacterium]